MTVSKGKLNWGKIVSYIILSMVLSAIISLFMPSGAFVVGTLLATVVFYAMRTRATTATQPGGYQPVAQRTNPSGGAGFCGSCGAPLKQGKTFCTECGAKVG